MNISNLNFFISPRRFFSFKRSRMKIFLFILCLLAIQNFSPFGSLSIVSAGKLKYNPGQGVWTADYIVVGTGAGGSPLLRKLTDDYSYSAIGLEAGDNHDADPDISIPANMLFIDKMKYNWLMVDNLKREVGVGRMTGGATSHNGMMYYRPSLAYINLLHDYGGVSWSPSRVKADIIELENYVTNDGSPIAASRGTGGFLDIRKPLDGPHDGANSLAFKIANWTAFGTGYAINNDYNNWDPTEGRTTLNAQLGPYPRIQLLQSADGSKRISAYTAFLPRYILNEDGSAADSRRQLKVFLKSTVTKILFNGNRAIGVLYVQDGVQYKVLARKEVILAASVFTSQLLQVSGVGPSNLLSSLGIPVIVDSPNVGKHLSNHVSLSVPFFFNSTEFPGVTASDPGALYPGGALFPLWDSNGPHETGFNEFQLTWFSVPPSYFAGIVVMHRPKSVGTVNIQSSDPLQIPIHNENILSDPYDVDKFSKFMYYCFQNKIADYITSQNPAYGAAIPRWNSLNDAKAYLLANAGRAYHYNGQARMAQSINDGVVDGKLRVYGTVGLRVVGSPVLPEMGDFALTGPSILTGYRLAKMLIQERGF